MKNGFTLIELLVVMGVISIMAALVLMAVNPGRQFMNARDTIRRTDIYALASALVQYQADNDGLLPDQNNFPTTSTCIGNVPPCFNLGAFIVPLYLSQLPQDPLTGTPAHTQYFVYQNTNRQIIVSATGEVTPTISTTR